jgi:hypothetical protein
VPKHEETGNQQDTKATILPKCAHTLEGVRKSTGLHFDDEGCAAAFLALHADSTAVLEYNLAAETEADASTIGLGGEKGNESMVNDIRRHAAAVVFYAD